MFAVYDISEKLPLILSVITIILFGIREFALRQSNTFYNNSYKGIPGACDYYAHGGHLFQIVKRGRNYRAYLTENMFLPNLKRDRYGDYIETCCHQEEDAERFLDRLFIEGG